MIDIAQNLFFAVGINKYTHKSWKPLNNAVGDVELLGNILSQKYGFETMRPYLLDAMATREEIHTLLTAAVGCSEYDSIIIYFAGHGNMWPEGKGNWVPYDGTDQVYSWISGGAILDHLTYVKAKHILLIHDCCFSGAFTTGQPKLSFLSLTDDELWEQASRIIFTSGAEVVVSDGLPGEGSPFSRVLCEYLDNYSRPTLKVSKLISAVTRSVTYRSGQTPRSSEINSHENKNGEMILRLVNPLDGGETNVDPDDFPLPDPASGPLDIPRTVTAADHKSAIAESMFELETNRVALDEVIRKERRVLMLGAAGAGKSFQMVDTARKVRGLGELVPIFKRLNAFDGQDVYHFLGIDADRLDSDEFVLFLDGLDEVMPDHFLKVVNAINLLGDNHPLLGMVISCRTNFYEVPQDEVEASLKGFSTYHLNDIRAKDILEHGAGKVKVDVEDFLEKANLNGLGELVHNPFFLNLLFQHFLDYVNLEVDRAKLMETAVAKAIGADDGNILEILEKMAFVMETMGRNFLTDEQMQALKLEKKELARLTDLKIFYKDEAQNHWKFEHNNIQEYLTAKVLSRLDFETLITTIAFEVGGKKRIRPSWLNTVAFLSTVGDKDIFEQLFDWIVANDNEAVVRLEPHRLSIEQRFLVFKGIFEFYMGKDLWLRSNLFDTIELVRFAKSGETVDYLIKVLGDKETKIIAKLNAIHVLFVFDVELIKAYRSQLLGVLMDLVKNNGFEPENMISVLGLIAQLKLADIEDVDYLIGKYRNSRNAYLRAGLYKLIADYGLADEYMQVLLDGLNLEEMKYGENDRTDVSLMDESFNLRRAIESIASSKGLQLFIEGLLKSPIRRFTFTRENREVLSKLVDNVVADFEKGNGKMYDLMLELYLVVQKDYDEHLLGDLGVFFKRTQTVKDFLMHLWRKPEEDSLGWDRLTLGILDEDLVKQFVILCKSKDLSIESLKQFHQTIFYQRHRHAVLLELLEALAKAELGVEPERPVSIDWQTIELQRAQRDFDLLFDKQEMIAELKRAFEKAGTEELSRDRVFSLMTENYHETAGETAQTALDLLRNFTDYGRTITLEKIINWVENSQLYAKFGINKIKTRLSSNQKVEVSEEQRQWIVDWCLNVGDNMELLWFFLHKLGIELREGQLLELTKYPNASVDGAVDQPGSLEMLEPFLDADKLKLQVLENLAGAELSIQAWISNIGYCLRKGIGDGLIYLVEALVTRQQESYKDKELLEFWFRNYRDITSIKRIIAETDAFDIKWKAIKLLKSEADQKEFLIEVLSYILSSEAQQLHHRQEAGNLLIELGDIRGFDFLADLILEKQDPTLDFRWGFRNLGIVTSIETLDKLIELLYISKRPEFKHDPFNDLESIVLNAMVNVGQASEENSIKVIAALEAFLDKYIGELPNLNFLHFTIARIRDGFAFKETVSFEKALALYEGLGN